MQQVSEFEETSSNFVDQSQLSAIILFVSCRRRTNSNLLIGVVLILFVSVFASVLRAGERRMQDSTDGVRRMAERLEAIILGTNPLKNPFMSEERAEAYRALLGEATRPNDKRTLQYQYGVELLNAGRPEQAFQEFQKLDQFVLKHQGLVDSRTLMLLRLDQALCYLRLGENENCWKATNCDGCLFPMQGVAPHQNQRGSRTAVQLYTAQLNKTPSDTRTLWLLNIAYMTLGEYPDRVPPQWRIDPKVFASDYDIKRFRDVAPAMGLAVDNLAGGCVTEDFDGDGFLDIMISNWALRGQLRLFRNNGNGTWTERTKEAGLVGEMGGLNLIHADYNNDGYPDVLVLRGAWMGEAGRYPNSLLRNNGDGSFSDVTEQAGLLSFHPTQTAVWFDYNNDGWIDLYIGNESWGSETHPCELYRNNGDGTFTECAARNGVAQVGFVKAAVSGDFNNDGRPDLFLSRLREPNILYRNDGPSSGGPSSDAGWVFTDVTAAARVAEPIDSFPSWFWDYDNDGWIDLFVCGFGVKSVGDIAADYLGLRHKGVQPRLYRNNHDGTFADVTRSANLWKVLLGMGANFGDLDNDGFLDFYIGTGDPDLSTMVPNRMFRNADGKVFQDVTTSGGFGHLQKGHGIAFADLDNDGDQDVFAEMGGAYPGDYFRNALYENPGHGNRWITIQFEGVKSNRAALGARIKVVVETQNGERTIHRTVSTGGSFGASPFRQEIGLGQAASIKSIEVFWPVTGLTQILKNVALDQFYRVREGAERAVPMQLTRFKFTPPKVAER